MILRRFWQRFNDKKKFLIGVAGILLLISFWSKGWLGGQSLPAEPPKNEYREFDGLLIQNGLFLVGQGSIIYGLEKQFWEAEEKYELPHGLLYDLAECESRLKHDGVWGDSGKSYGLFQWQLNSWWLYNKKFGLELNILKAEDQIEMTAKVLAEKGEHNWKNCWAKINY